MIRWISLAQADLTFHILPVNWDDVAVVNVIYELHGPPPTVTNPLFVIARIAPSARHFDLVGQATLSNGTHPLLDVLTSEERWVRGRIYHQGQLQPESFGVSFVDPTMVAAWTLVSPPPSIAGAEIWIPDLPGVDTGLLGGPRIVDAAQTKRLCAMVDDSLRPR